MHSSEQSSSAAGILRILRGHIPELLRHPYAAAVVDDLYLCASGQQRNAMVAEFYAREYVLFEQVSQAAHCTASKAMRPHRQVIVLQHQHCTVLLMMFLQEVADECGDAFDPLVCALA